MIQTGQGLTATEKHSQIALCLTGYLRTAILADTIQAPYLRITPGTLCQHGQKSYSISGSRTSITLPCNVTHTYIAHIWSTLPPWDEQTGLERVAEIKPKIRAFIYYHYFFQRSPAKNTLPAVSCNSHTKPLSWHFYRPVYF